MNFLMVKNISTFYTQVFSCILIICIFLLSTDSSDQVQALLGNIAELPCDLNAHIGEKIRLVLWSRNDTVIYR